MSTEATVAFLAVVAARFVVPLLIPRFPLPAILACLVLDAVDQTIFQSFGYDPPGYQGYDKAMDVFYLAIAFLSTLQNWTSTAAVSVSRFLFFSRMTGVLLFELTAWRPLLLIFPNTFEYFFIAYELVRLRHDPRRLGARAWLLVAAAIWVVVKLPQEYWIHVAQLDVTDTLRDIPWAATVLGGALLVLAAALWFGVRPRMPAPDHSRRVAADPLPAEMDTAAERDAWSAVHVRVRSWATVEKVALIGVLSTIYALITPWIEVSPTRMLVGVGTVVVLNSAISLAVARRIGSREGLAAAVAARVGVNVALVLVASLLVPVRGALGTGDTVFFVVLLSLLVTFHDRFAPVAAVRADHDARDPAPVSGRHPA
ncbi:MAG: hypothetical protein ACRCSN_05680 [Dermatophilaceae bacterium]